MVHGIGGGYVSSTMLAKDDTAYYLVVSGVLRGGL